MDSIVSCTFYTQILFFAWISAMLVFFACESISLQKEYSSMCLRLFPFWYLWWQWFIAKQSSQNSNFSVFGVINSVSLRYVTKISSIHTNRVCRKTKREQKTRKMKKKALIHAEHTNRKSNDHPGIGLNHMMPSQYHLLTTQIHRTKAIPKQNRRKEKGKKHRHCDGLNINIWTTDFRWNLFTSNGNDDGSIQWIRAASS